MRDGNSKGLRNGEIEFWRAVFCLIIFIFHLGFDTKSSPILFIKGQIGVEFFFILSGLFMAKSVDSHRESADNKRLGTDSIRYVVHKYTAIFPYHIFAFVCGFIIYLAGHRMGLYELVENILLSVPQFFMIHIDGLYGNFKVVSVEWYISAMLIAMLFIYPLLRKFYDIYVHAAAPLISLTLAGYCIFNRSSYLGSYDWNGIATWGVLRGVMMLNLGCIAYEIAKFIAGRNYRGYKRILLSLAGLFGYFTVIAMSNFRFDERIRYVLILILMFSVSVSFSGTNFYGKLFDNRLCRYLGRLSLPFYLNTNIVRFTLMYLEINTLRYRYFVVIAVLANFALSGAEMLLVEKIREKRKSAARAGK